MKTGGIEYLRGIYKINTNKSNENFKYYNLLNTELLEKCNLFTDLLRVEKDNGFHEKSRWYDNWLKLRNTENWETCTRSGLAFTKIERVYEGNISQVLDLKTQREVHLRGKVYYKPYENPKHLLIAQVDEFAEVLVLDIFKDFYPNKREVLNLFIKEHQYHL